ncbi:helix-turn-helix domain-containing protein [Tenacibaculum sp. 190524A02b]|uniref:helix-turn-helix domain-containing protein n=1 Tax=Tenacibaculum vairaonense TaxID=3137860 RepID=UPI0032B23751
MLVLDNNRELNVSKLNEIERQDFEKLMELIIEKRMYSNSRLTLKVLSEQTNMHSKYISKLINSFTGTNFNEFINKFRINEFKEKAKDTSYENYSILGIANESGFSSKSTFYKAFKKFEKKSPSEYINSL